MLLLIGNGLLQKLYIARNVTLRFYSIGNP
jgi:hypothetical protein